MHQSVWTNKKAVLLAAKLKLNTTYAAAHIIRFWTWALDNVQDGDLSGLPPEVIAFGAAWEGDAGVFVEAAISAGWLDKTESGLHIHDWYEYAGRLIEKRREDAERKRQSRRQAKDVQRMSSGHPADDPRSGAVTVPNRTLPKDHSSSSTPTRTEIFGVFEKEFGRLLSPMEIEQLKQWESEHGQDLILEALKRASLGGKHTFKYLGGILLKWQKNKIRTIQDVERFEEEFKKSKGDHTHNRIRAAPEPDPQKEKRKAFIRALEA